MYFEFISSFTLKIEVKLLHKNTSLIFKSKKTTLPTGWLGLPPDFSIIISPLFNCFCSIFFLSISLFINSLFCISIFPLFKKLVVLITETIFWEFSVISVPHSPVIISQISVNFLYWIFLFIKHSPSYVNFLNW